MPKKIKNEWNFIEFIKILIFLKIFVVLCAIYAVMIVYIKDDSSVLFGDSIITLYPMGMLLILHISMIYVIGFWLYENGCKTNNKSQLLFRIGLICIFLGMGMSELLTAGAIISVVGLIWGLIDICRKVV